MTDLYVTKFTVFVNYHCEVLLFVKKKGMGYLYKVMYLYIAGLNLENTPRRRKTNV